MSKISRFLYAMAVVVLFITCRSYFKARYNFNRPFEFTSKQEYLTSVSKEMEFEETMLLYVDSTDYTNFMHTFIGSSSSVYFGAFINDSLSVKKTAFLKDNESCIGRMEKEIYKNISAENFIRDSLDNSVNLSNYQFYSIKDNKKYSVSESKKKIKIVLAYAYDFGTYYKPLYQEIIAAYKKNIQNCDLYIISLDPLGYFKN